MKGHNKELFFPGIVKSCSRTVERVEVRRADSRILLLPDILLPLAVDPLDLSTTAASFCAAFLPSRIATAVSCLDRGLVRSGSGTIEPSVAGAVTCKSGGRCSCARVFAVSGSVGAYLSARD